MPAVMKKNWGEGGEKREGDSPNTPKAKGNIPNLAKKPFTFFRSSKGIGEQTSYYKEKKGEDLQHVSDP